MYTLQQPWCTPNHGPIGHARWPPLQFLYQTHKVKCQGNRLNYDCESSPQIMSSVQRFMKGKTLISVTFESSNASFNWSTKMSVFLLKTSTKESNILKWKAGVNKRRAFFHSSPEKETNVDEFRNKKKKTLRNLLLRLVRLQAKMQGVHNRLYWCFLYLKESPV